MVYLIGNETARAIDHCPQAAKLFIQERTKTNGGHGYPKAK